MFLLSLNFFLVFPRMSQFIKYGKDVCFPKDKLFQFGWPSWSEGKKKKRQYLVFHAKTPEKAFENLPE